MSCMFSFMIWGIDMLFGKLTPQSEALNWKNTLRTLSGFDNWHTFIGVRMTLDILTLTCTLISSL